MKKNKDLKRLMIMVFLFVLLCFFAGNVWTISLVRQMEREHYATIAVLLESVKEQYPDFNDEEWIAFLNSGGDGAEGRRLLKQYGFFEDNAFSLRQKNLENRLLLILNGLLFLLCATVSAAAIPYFYKRKRNIGQLVRYMQRVEQGCYALDMTDNAEDELSALKNELYKVTVVLKESAELAVTQKKALADSVSDISHQLKTPLTSVMVLLDNLSESSHMDEKTRKQFLAEITRQLSGVSFLVTSLLKLSKLDAGVVEFLEETVQWDSLLAEVTDKLEVLAELKQITIKREGTEGMRMRGDERWLLEAVSNIVKNAIEHSREGQKILICTEENAVYQSVTVKDFGEGLEEEEQKHIFERFYKSRNAGNDSVGIGLALAKEIVEKQGGCLTVESSPGEGCAFTMKFIKI